MIYYEVKTEEERAKIKESLTGEWSDKRSLTLFEEGRIIVGHYDWQYFICVEYRKNNIGLPIPVYGLMKRDGSIIIDFAFGAISHFYGEYLLINRYLPDLKVRRFGITKFDGTMVCPYEYSYVGKVKEGTFAVEKDNKLGFMDMKWNIVIPLMYIKDNDVEPEFHEGYVCVKYFDSYGFIDHYNNRLTPFEFDNYSEFKNGIAIVERTKRAMWGYIDYETLEVDLEGALVTIKCDSVKDDSGESIYGGSDILDAYEGDPSNMWNTD